LQLTILFRLSFLQVTKYVLQEQLINIDNIILPFMIAGNIDYTLGPSWYCIPTSIVHNYAYNTFNVPCRSKKLLYTERDIRSS